MQRLTLPAIRAYTFYNYIAIFLRVTFRKMVFVYRNFFQTRDGMASFAIEMHMRVSFSRFVHRVFRRCPVYHYPVDYACIHQHLHCPVECYSVVKLPHFLLDVLFGKRYPASLQCGDDGYPLRTFLYSVILQYVSCVHARCRSLCFETAACFHIYRIRLQSQFLRRQIYIKNGNYRNSYKFFI